MASELRQMTLEEAVKIISETVGADWRVAVTPKDGGHVQIRTTLK